MGRLDDLEIFEHVARLGSFTEAAERLSMSKSKVSVRVSALEERLGARLLHRTTRAVRLTDLGIGLAEGCRRMLDEAQEAELTVQSAAPVPHGLLRMAASRVFGQAFIAPLLGELLKRWPGLRCEVLLTERQVDLVEEGFDLAFRLGPQRDSSLIGRRLGLGRVAYLASPDYLARCGEPRHPDELSGHATLAVGRGDWVRWAFMVEGSLVQLEVTPRVVVNDLDSVRTAAVEGLGITWIPRFFAERELASGCLREVFSHCPSPRPEVWAVYPGSRRPAAKVRAMVDLMLERFGATQPW
jgi:DNA-binding transcriptional LysR family regulator